MIVSYILCGRYKRMLVAKDFREKARVALRGRWASGVGTGFLASLLGAYTAFSSGGGDFELEERTQQSLYDTLPLEVYNLVMSIIGVMALILLVYTIITLIVGGPISLGYAKYNLGLVDGQPVTFMDLFSQFQYFGAGFGVHFKRLLFIFLWTFLFVLPGAVVGVIATYVIIFAMGNAGMVIAVWVLILCMLPGIVFGMTKTYSYSMAAYILYENQGMTAKEAIQRSIELMKGNRWRLFCLGFSFIGWGLLSILSLGIGMLWLKPYQEAAYAAFYREIYRERYGEPVKAEDSFYQGYSQGFNDFNK